MVKKIERFPGQRQIFLYSAFDVDGTGNLFETDHAREDTPTQMLETTKQPANLMQGVIRRIYYWFPLTRKLTRFTFTVEMKR